MTVDWTITLVYNTIMSVSTGVGLLLIIRFAKHLKEEKMVNCKVGLSDLPYLFLF